MRYAILAAVLVGSAASSASAQNWAQKMFKDGATKDFGTVPHGAQLFHRFPFTNIWAVPMEISTIQSGCGCVTATASKRVLQPRESGTIDVSMDARRFTGNKSVVVRVTVGPDFISTAELKVTAQSRADIVFNPGQVNFGQVSQGQGPVQNVDVEYAGQLAWELTEVIVGKELPLDVTFKQKYRRPGQVGYTLSVKLKEDAPAGLLKELVYLKTNDPNAGMVPLLVEGNVAASLAVTPEKLTLGAIKMGEQLTRRVVVKGVKAFKVVEVEGLGDGLELGVPPNSNSATVQTVTFKCQFDKPGDFKREVKIKTDLQPAPVSVTIEGTVAP